MDMWTIYIGAVTKHLINNEQYAWSYSPDIFSVIIKANTDYHLNNSESLYIKPYKPSLCKKELLVCLKVIKLKIFFVYR